MIKIPTSQLRQLKRRILTSLLHSKEVYNPVADDTDVVLSNTQQGIIDNNTVNSIVVYVNGLRMDETEDYTYDSSNYTFTFDEAFEGDEKVTIVLSYIDDSGTDVESLYNSSKYEKTIEKTKTYATFTNTTLNLDIDNYSVFVIDMTTNSANALTITIPNTTGESIGKVIMMTILLGSTVPTITWGSNILWNSPEYLAPELSANKAYSISFVQINSSTKYIGNVNSEFDTDDLVIS